MRLLPVSLYALFASVVIAKSVDTPAETAEDAADVQESTVFNGISVPPLLDVDGEKLEWL